MNRQVGRWTERQTDENKKTDGHMDRQTNVQINN
jgi:hypothetical protein